MSKISPKEMAEAVKTWHPGEPIKGALKATALAAACLSQEGKKTGFYWANVAAIILAGGKNRAQRRKDKRKSSPVKEDDT